MTAGYAASWRDDSIGSWLEEGDSPRRTPRPGQQPPAAAGRGPAVGRPQPPRPAQQEYSQQGYSGYPTQPAQPGQGEYPAYGQQQGYPAYGEQGYDTGSHSTEGYQYQTGDYPLGEYGSSGYGQGYATPAAGTPALRTPVIDPLDPLGLGPTDRTGAHSTVPVNGRVRPAPTPPAPPPAPAPAQAQAPASAWPSSSETRYDVVLPDAIGAPMLGFRDGYWFALAGGSASPLTARTAILRHPDAAGSIVQITCWWMREHRSHERALDLATELALTVSEVVRMAGLRSGGLGERH